MHEWEHLFHRVRQRINISTLIRLKVYLWGLILCIVLYKVWIILSGEWWILNNFKMRKLEYLNAGRELAIKCWKIRLKFVWSVGWSAENSDRILWVKRLHRRVPFQSKRDPFFIIMGENVNYMCKTGMFYLGCRKLRKIHLMIRIVFIVTYHDSSDVVGWLF